MGLAVFCDLHRENSVPLSVPLKDPVLWSNFDAPLFGKGGGFDSPMDFKAPELPARIANRRKHVSF
jgi:hypothetical protein